MELDPLRATYGRYLRLLDGFGACKQNLLEVGCGNGFFLDVALDQGYASVRGIEPSRSSIENASARVKPFLICDILRPGSFDDASFDVVCLFQVLDHIPDPRRFLEHCQRLLRPGGLLLAINHDVTAFSARLLGERSPIFDVEHTFLYAPPTIAAMARLAGFEPQLVGRVWNTCSIGYLIWLLPLPAAFKRAVLRAVDRSVLAQTNVTLPLGNLVFVGRTADRASRPIAQPAIPSSARSSN